VVRGAESGSSGFEWCIGAAGRVTLSRRSARMMNATTMADSTRDRGPLRRYYSPG
jgi:hypothetical protein